MSAPISINTLINSENDASSEVNKTRIMDENMESVDTAIRSIDHLVNTVKDYAESVASVTSREVQPLDQIRYNVVSRDDGSYAVVENSLPVEENEQSEDEDESMNGFIVPNRTSTPLPQDAPVPEGQGQVTKTVSDDWTPYCAMCKFPFERSDSAKCSTCNTGLVFKCRKCPRIHLSVNHFDRHSCQPRLREEYLHLECGLGCGKRFRRVDSHRQHAYHCERNPGPFNQCPLCAFKTTHSYGLDIHMSIKHPIGCGRLNNGEVGVPRRNSGPVLCIDLTKKIRDIAPKPVEGEPWTFEKLIDLTKETQAAVPSPDKSCQPGISQSVNYETTNVAVQNPNESSGFHSKIIRDGYRTIDYSPNLETIENNQPRIVKVRFLPPMNYATKPIVPVPTSNVSALQQFRTALSKGVEPPPTSSDEWSCFESTKSSSDMNSNLIFGDEAQQNFKIQKSKINIRPSPY